MPSHSHVSSVSTREKYLKVTVYPLLPLIFGKVKVKVKVQLSLCFFLIEHHTLKAYWGSRGIAPHILDLGTR
jgi:hypothetical protein